MAWHGIAFYGVIPGGDGLAEARASGGPTDEGEGRREAPKGRG